MTDRVEECAKVAETYAELMRRQAELICGNPVGPIDAKFMAAFRAGQDIADNIRALAAVPPAPPSKQFTPKQAANLKAAFAEEGIPWPNVNLNSKDTHLAELLQQCVDAFEADGGDLDQASRILCYTREVIQWRLRGADGERPAPPSIPEREKVLEALKVGLICAGNLCQLGNYFSREVAQIESAIAGLEGK